jgi:hypothetical protein
MNLYAQSSLTASAKVIKLISSVEISPENNLPKIVELAGGGSGFYYSGGWLYVEGVFQVELDNALTAYNSDLEAYVLEPLRETKKDEVAEEANSYIELSYPSFRRELFIALAEEARNDGLTNRAAYINQLLAWVKTVVAQTIVYGDAIDAETDIDTITNYTADYSSFDATNPNVTIKAALAIPD